MTDDEFTSRYSSILKNRVFASFDSETRRKIIREIRRYRFSVQETKQIIDIAADFAMWGERPAVDFFRRPYPSRKAAFEAIRDAWTRLRVVPKSYADFEPGRRIVAAQTDLEPGSRPISSISRDSLGFGRCPVASPKTRCCNLLTLDAVEGCAFECSYCSVRSFYDDHRIGIDDKFVENLSRLEIDPDRPYHIGTGQSSDSLMWGNRGGVLGALLDFAREHPRVILELKTKSDNVAYLLERDIPANLICTWSLNTPTIVENEEHGTAPVENRVEAAKKLAARGNLVGFHFHPIVEYDGYRRDYPELYRRVTDAFHPDDVALVSFGTLTFIKPVIRSLRERRPASKILQMPLEPAGGKYSYPLEQKEIMFREAYEAFSPWHGKVFFYLCMEDAALWPAVFGSDFEDNDAFERAMIGSYEEKIREKRLSHR